MEKQKNTCPYCNGQNQWFMHSNDKEQVYQCTDCIRYFRVEKSKARDLGSQTQVVSIKK